MTPDRKRQVEEICQAALHRDATSREAFLAQACAGDAALRQEVESFLAHLHAAEHFLETPAIEIAAKAIAAIASSAVGRHLGPFHVLSLLGSGGMGDVYRARDPRLRRDVAIKILSRVFTSDPDRFARFQREAQVLASLNHPNIATIHELGEEDGVPFIVMEYVEGDTLKAKVRSGPLDASEIIALATEIAEALDAAHSIGIIHRDVKSANIMITPRGRAKVLDFGLAKWTIPHDPFSHDATCAAIQSAAVMGTVPYMSPEQALGKTLDQRSDLFSLGVVLYEIATGHLPFSGATAYETIDHIIHGDPKPIRSVNSKIPPGLERVIRRCLTKRTEERIQNAAELVRALRASDANGPSLSRDDKVDNNLPQQPPPFIGRGRELAGGQDILGQTRRTIDDAATRALTTFAETIRAGHGASSLPESMLRVVRQHSPRNAAEHVLVRAAAWADQRYAIDTRFARLTLLLDQGRDAEQTRWQAQAETLSDLRAVLAKVEGTAPAVVLLGPPGSGKSTLLRRLEYDLATDAVRDGGPKACWTFFVPLGSYTAAPGQLLPLPHDWLATRWAGDFPHLPAFDEVSRSGRLTLLLDALNEMPHANREDYRVRVGLWRTCVVDLVRRAPQTRVVFSCRSLDYSELLSTSELAVPQVRIERLADEEVQSFLVAYRPGQAEAIWRQLMGTPQLDLFRSPYYLKLLIAQSSRDGKIPDGRAVLFTGFVREALHREVTARHPLFQVGGLLEDRDHDRIARREWYTAYDLPSRGPLMSSLSALAFGLQRHLKSNEQAQVRAPFDEAVRILGPHRPDDVLKAGVALQVLDDDSARDEVLFVHQLLQEYFAARQVAATPVGSLTTVTAVARVPWRETELIPVHFESDNDPLPPAQQSGWEETFMLAAAMAPADRFLSSLMTANLPLAGRCAAQPDVKISQSLLQTLRQGLLDRSRHADADLRSRIAAARALGELGDLRFQRREGPSGEYLLPPFIEIPGGAYSIGSEDGDADERPVHPVLLDGFAIAQFPVTNAEWQRFMVAGGYDNDGWWDTEAARRWRRGEGASDGPGSRWQEIRRRFQRDLDRVRAWQREGRVTSQQMDDWEAVARLSGAERDRVLEKWYPGGRQTQPAWWNDSAFNHPSQPVVGVCWYEARAYCAWLSAQVGRLMCLPAEPQWEAAACGTAGCRYSWGSEFDPARCNTHETHVRNTTPIGVFPGGDTPGGVIDMTGNVWEWTSSSYQDYPYDQRNELEDATCDDMRRVLRGGAWNLNQDFARAAYRLDREPDIRYYSFGFRMVCVPPIR